MNKHDDRDKDRRTLDILTREVGLLEMEDGRVTADDRRWAETVVSTIGARIAAHRRDRLPKIAPPIKKAAPITERLRAMPRAALEALLGGLVEPLGPQAQIAYRKLDTLSDDDLRRMIQRIETHTKKG